MVLVSPPAPARELSDISAGWRYRSGADHFALDYPMPTGTALYAVRDGVVLDCNDGVVDHTPSKPGNFFWQAGKNSPSNWILLRVKFAGRYVTVYYQHLFKVKVRKGQTVKAGQIIGYSGSTGNATGPHLHIAAMWGGNYSASTRYAYMLGNGKYPPPPSGSVCVFSPAQIWGTSDFVRFSNCKRGGDKDDVLQVQKALKAVVNLDYSSGPGIWGPQTEAAWNKVGVLSGTGDSIHRLAWLGAKAPRNLGITAIY